MSGPGLLPRSRGTGRGAALTLLFAALLVAGVTEGSWGDAAPNPSSPAPSTPPTREDTLKAAAVEAMTEGKSGAAAAAEAVSRSGDRWGAVYDAAEYEKFEDSLDGEYTGVGLWAKRTRGGAIEIRRVQPGGPAARAGITEGDRLRTVDGHQVGGRPVTEVVSLLRGEAGTPVELGLRRGSREWTRTLSRARLSTQSVVAERSDRDTVLIKVASFTKGSGERVRDEVRAAPAGAGVILDLRGNSGGLVTEATDAASAFLDGGLVATYGLRGDQQALNAERGGDTVRPLVVLVDGGTMSAAELLAGALRDRGRAVVVGTRTFGKGSVQLPTRLPDGSVAELTVGHYRTPAGREVDGVGITPDLTAGEGAEEQARTVLSGLGGGA